MTWPPTNPPWIIDNKGRRQKKKKWNISATNGGILPKFHIQARWTKMKCTRLERKMTSMEDNHKISKMENLSNHRSNVIELLLFDLTTRLELKKDDLKKKSWIYQQPLVRSFPNFIFNMKCTEPLNKDELQWKLTSKYQTWNITTIAGWISPKL